jgi:hypothetical protein
MSKKKPTSFLEVFGAQPGTKPARARSTVRKARPRRAASDDADGITLALKPEAMVFAGFGAAALLAIVFMLGYGLGRRRGAPDGDAGLARVQAESADRPAASEGTRRLAIEQETGRVVQPPFWTVRIVAGVRLSGARDVRDFIRDRGYDAFVVKLARSRGYAVNVGRFPDKNGAEAVQAKEELVRMTFGRNTQFDSAYFLQMSDTGSIVP